MGYTTTFKGRIKVDPQLNIEEIRFLNNFSGTRRMKRLNGPYYCGLGSCGQAYEMDILDYNEPPDGQPGLWCQWVPTSDGKFIEWNGAEKFYNSVEWMKYIIEHFLKPNPKALANQEPYFSWEAWRKEKQNRKGLPIKPPSTAEYASFMAGMIYGGHVLNGTIKAKGEERGDRWTLIVKNNKVTRTPKTSRI